MMKVRLGEEIRRLREDRGLTLSKLARMADMPNTTLIRIESGLVSPNIRTVERLADQLGVEVYELLRPQRGLASIGALGMLAASSLAFLLLPGITKWASPIIHRMEPSS